MEKVLLESFNKEICERLGVPYKPSKPNSSRPNSPTYEQRDVGLTSASEAVNVNDKLSNDAENRIREVVIQAKERLQSDVIKPLKEDFVKEKARSITGSDLAGEIAGMAFEGVVKSCFPSLFSSKQ